MKTKRTLTIATLLVALAALLTLGGFRGTRQVQAQYQTPPPVNDRISFGMVGISEGQTVRVSVVNTLPPPVGESQPQTQRVVLTFLDADGHRLRSRDGSIIRRAVELQPGNATFLDLNANDLQYPPGPTRLQLRAVVTVVPPPIGDNNQIPPPVNDRIVTTVEVINNANGRTVFALSAPPSIRQQPPPTND
jgi:hypothetical protein